MPTAIVAEIEHPATATDDEIGSYHRSMAAALCVEVEHGADHRVCAVFDDAAAAVEGAVIGQWETQKATQGTGFKIRAALHTAASPQEAMSGAHAALAVANGNQIVMTQATDSAVPGLDARGLGAFELPGMSEPIIMWLLTDSRPNIDRRPPRLLPTDLT